MSRFYRAIRAVFAPVVRFLFRVKVIGKENIPAPGGSLGYLVVSNHISNLDAVLICAAFPEQICYMGKKELFRVPLLNLLIRALGAYPVDRKSGGVHAIRESIALLESGRNIGIFPQGTRCPGKGMSGTPVKSGCASIAVRTGAAIVPVAIRTKKQKFAFFRRNEICIGSPLSPSDLHYDSTASGEYARITAAVSQTIDSLLKKSAI